MIKLAIYLNYVGHWFGQISIKTRTLHLQNLKYKEPCSSKQVWWQASGRGTFIWVPYVRRIKCTNKGAAKFGDFHLEVFGIMQKLWSLPCSESTFRVPMVPLRRLVEAHMLLNSGGAIEVDYGRNSGNIRSMENMLELRSSPPFHQTLRAQMVTAWDLPNEGLIWDSRTQKR